MNIKIGKYPTHRWYHRLFCLEPKQKTKIKINSWDTWSMDYTLAHIILPMLKQLKKTHHGAPYVDNTDVPKKLRMNKQQKLEHDRKRL